MKPSVMLLREEDISTDSSAEEESDSENDDVRSILSI